MAEKTRERIRIDDHLEHLSTGAQISVGKPDDDWAMVGAYVGAAGHTQLSVGYDTKEGAEKVLEKLARELDARDLAAPGRPAARPGRAG